ncbi:MAG: hypothetical protein JXQ29_09555, partial [Planctomycetes bacterium]|nr:hypothetical protein [Planctomycetota bacterium]
MRTAMGFLVLLAALLAAGFAVAPAAAQKMHEDNAWGFKVKVPSGWREIPLQVAERWIIGRYQSDRSYLSEEGFNHNPEMKIVVFPEEAKKEAGRIERKEDEDKVRVEIKARYKDYQAYLKGNFTGGGYYFSKEEQGEIAGVKVSMYEVTVEKLTYMGKQRLIAWVFHLPDADIAIEFNLLENRYDKLKGLCHGTLKSFELAERTTEAKQKENILEIPSPEKWAKMTPIERMKNRKERSEAFIQEAVKNLPEGWKTKSETHFEVLTRADARFTKKVADQAEAIREWLDKTFFEIGEDYVPRTVLRICADSAEERAYTDASSDAWSLDWESREIVVSKRTDFGQSYEFEWLSQGICSHWLYNRNRLLFDYMPNWLRWGLVRYVGSGVAKGKNLTFKQDPWERDQIRKANRESKLVANRDILKMTDKEFHKANSEAGGALGLQCAALVRYMMSPICQRDKRTKDLVFTYLRNLDDVAKPLEEKQRAESKKKGEEPKTAAEERELRKKRQEADEKEARYIAD